MRIIACTALLLLTAPAGAGQSAVAVQDSGSAQSYTISGRVVDALNGTALGDTEVAIAPVANRSAVETVRSASDGRFAFRVTQPGKYALMARRRGYGFEDFDAHPPYSTSIAVGPGLESEALLFRLHAEGSISGSVADSQNDPVAGADVTLFMVSTLGGEQQTRIRSHTATDDLGKYHFRRLPAGKYYIAVSGRPWYAEEQRRGRDVPAAMAGDQPLDVAYPTTYYGDTTDPDQSAALELGWGERGSADVVLRPVPAARLALLSTDAGQVRNFRVQMAQSFKDVPFVTPASTRYQSQGNRVELTGIAPGRYTIEIGRRQPETTDARGTEWRMVDVGNETELDISQPLPMAQCSGLVTLEGQPHLPYGITVVLRPIPAGRFGSGLVAPSGEFACKEPIAPGVYDVILSGQASEIQLKTVSASGAAVRGSRLTISQAGPVVLKLTITKGIGRVEGTVLQEGKPFAGAMVVLVPSDPENNRPLFRRDQSDSDGTFTLSDVVPGSYTVIALRDWDTEWAKPSVLTRYLAGGQALQVSANGAYQAKVSLQEK